jgi:hypothetical protein
MKTIFKLILILILFPLISCTNENLKDDKTAKNIESNDNKILILKVDYTTNIFEGGKELSFDVNTTTFTTNNEYVPPGDFGSIKIFYTELNTLLFYGDIIWMGNGNIHYPTDFLPASSFPYSLTTEVNPEPVYENIFDPNVYPANSIMPPYNYSLICGDILSLVKVKQYRNSNPNAPVKLFLYQPSVGIGDPATWKWIIMFKN